MWLTKVRETTGQTVEVDWQPFSLAQINAGPDEELKVWERPEIIDGSDTTLLAHQAGLAAKRQGKEAFESFFWELLKSRHEEKKDLADPAVIEEAVQRSGIDAGQFQEDLKDPDLLRIIGESHTRAVEEHGAFGVPTYVFPSGGSAFIKMFPPTDEEAGPIYDNLTTLVSEHQHVGEVKRPQPPWPHGVI